MMLGWGLICTQAWLNMSVMSEACVIFPTSGAFIDHAARFLDPALAFALGKSTSLSSCIDILIPRQVHVNGSRGIPRWPPKVRFSVSSSPIGPMPSQPRLA
jgi:amino acid permease